MAVWGRVRGSPPAGRSPCTHPKSPRPEALPPRLPVPAAPPSRAASSASRIRTTLSPTNPLLRPGVRGPRPRPPPSPNRRNGPEAPFLPGHRHQSDSGQQIGVCHDPGHDQTADRQARTAATAFAAQGPTRRRRPRRRVGRRASPGGAGTCRGATAARPRGRPAAALLHRRPWFVSPSVRRARPGARGSVPRQTPPLRRYPPPWRLRPSRIRSWTSWRSCRQLWLPTMLYWQ
mmetsp:Transcript_85836/g.276084  ORF Transcript_85836/g.276084 Transcript_85836/m.276084 type:complete len:232 (-) Transcript_85836:6-701(-)